MNRFKLQESFIERYKGRQPKWGPVGYITFKRTYARQKDDGTTEEFWETVKRVVEGCYSIQQSHCEHLGVAWDQHKAQRSAQEMFERIWEFKFLPPGRGLWIMGTDVVEKKGSASLNNCGYISTEDLKVDIAEPFCWMMDMLMLGVGVGFDADGAGTITIQEPKQGIDVHVVEDSREGWVDIFRRILRAYSGQSTLPKEIDYSLVREEGALIKTFGGTSSGYKPLDELLNSVRDVLDPLVGKTITVTAINDIFNLVGRCVVAGNVRRSAQLSLGNPIDAEFLQLKDPEVNQERLMHHGWASNNSIKAEVGMDYSEVAKMTAKNGEPGYVWLNNIQSYSRMNSVPDHKDYRVKGTNPCSEQSLESAELCTLVESFPINHDSYEDYEKTLKYAYLYAKTVTLVKTHSPRTNAVLQRNRRIGCSMSGIVQAMNKFGRREFFNWCDLGYEYLEDLDSVYSDWLCVPRSKKKTSVKPSGSVSLLPGVTPGIHHPHSQYYIRRIRFQKNSPLVDMLSSRGYPIEDDAYSPNTSVVSFPIKEKYFSRGKKEVSMWEQLEIAAQMQEYWADNQVSVTVTFRPEEAEDIRYALELYETRLKSVSFLPITDHGYVQAPYETIEQEEYEDLSSKVTPIVEDEENRITNEVIERFCDGDTCVIVPK